VTLGGNVFHVRAPATGNARSPSEDRRVAGTTTSIPEAECSRWGEWISDTSLKSSEKYSEPRPCRQQHTRWKTAETRNILVITIDDRRSTTELFHRYCTRLERPLSFTTDSMTLTDFIHHIKIYRYPSIRGRVCQWLREWRRVYSRWIIAATQRIVYIEPSLMEKTCRESEPVRRSDARDDRSPISEHLRQTTNEHCIYLHCHDVTVQCPLRLLTYLLTHLFIGIYTNVQCPLSGMQRMPSNNFVN